ncbi:MAG: hypothetical protein ACFHU9_16845 [Fluviicola sp.]
MKKFILLIHLIALPALCVGQDSDPSRIGFYGGMVLNHSFGNFWYNERGVRLGASTMPKQFHDTLTGESLFNSAFNFSVEVTESKRHQHFSGITTNLGDENGYNEGFGRVEFNRVSPSLTYDFGFKLHEKSLINPYVTSGGGLDFYYSRFHQELYGENSTSSGISTIQPITATTTLGVSLGLGTKLLLSQRIIFDIRYEIYGNWALNTNTHGSLPEINSFQHIGPGNPTFQLRERRFQSGGIFSINFLVVLRRRE